MPMNGVLSAPAFGAGWYKKLTDYNYSTVQGLHGGVGTLFPGAAFAIKGAVYQVVQNRSGGDLAVGDCVSLNVGDASRTGGIATGVTPAVLLTDDTHDTDMTGDPAWPSFVVITAGALATTDNMQLREIKANTAAAAASTLTVAKAHPEDGPAGTDITSVDIFTGTLDNTYKYTAVVPYEVVKSDLGALATSIVQGIVVSTVITDNYFGIIQLPQGFGLAKVDGTTDLVVGDLLIASTTAGVLAKWVVTTTDPTTAQVNQSKYVVGRVWDAFTDNATGLRLVQFMSLGNAAFPYPIL